MTKKDANTEMRRCIGSKTFGIEPHEAPTSDFPKQPSQKDGLGRMCKPHWRQYTNALRKAALARKAADAEAAPAAEPESVASHSESAEAIRANRAEREAVTRAIRQLAEPEPPAPRRSRRAKSETSPEAEAAAE